MSTLRVPYLALSAPLLVAFLASLACGGQGSAPSDDGSSGDTPTSDGATSLGSTASGSSDGSPATGDTSGVDDTASATGETTSIPPGELECPIRNQDPNTIFCDDFESMDSLVVSEDQYYEVESAQLDTSVSVRGNASVRFTYEPGDDQAGKLHLAMGNIPAVWGVQAAADNNHAPGEDLQEVYWRFYLMMEEGWEGNPYKLTRAHTVIGENHAQAMIAHLWEDAELGIKIDPVSLVRGGEAVATTFNDFDNMCWMNRTREDPDCPDTDGGHFPAISPQIFSPEFAGQWLCIEVHVELNSSGQPDGVFEYWIDDQLIDRHDHLNLLDTYSGYGINAIWLENYWNGGATPKTQSRHWDNFVVSRARIGCLD